MPDLFEPDSEYTTAQKLKAVEREIGFRKFVYPRRVIAGKMKAEVAKFEVDVFEAIAADYRTKL